ncbi:hypothetical protein PAXRUDRAFT_621315 [Paxillus rubicundulus Ve08.2h10]|uniref:Uncharacterized protein n=1 Tax=Paxillus rubicundulus Ve08.2h10 TaxID=930991 RepID=A0A0D0CZN6_9AGAM|nr:hypothetical protein PAXRUDRAFT_621315 [Paxillus rubicundulus Ve08.2h10]
MDCTHSPHGGGKVEDGIHPFYSSLTEVQVAEVPNVALVTDGLRECRRQGDICNADKLATIKEGLCNM